MVRRRAVSCIVGNPAAMISQIVMLNLCLSEARMFSLTKRQREAIAVFDFHADPVDVGQWSRKDVARAVDRAMSSQYEHCQEESVIRSYCFAVDATCLLLACYVI